MKPSGTDLNFPSVTHWFMLKHWLWLPGTVGAWKTHPTYGGVGRTLLLFARQRSLALGYGGRVGLHALPESEEFYRRNQMPEYDPDPGKEGLVYFEYGVLRR